MKNNIAGLSYPQNPGIFTPATPRGVSKSKEE